MLDVGAALVAALGAHEGRSYTAHTGMGDWFAIWDLKAASPFPTRGEKSGVRAVAIIPLCRAGLVIILVPTG